MLLLVTAFTSVFAQADDTPLLQMLARIPDSENGRDFLTYADYQALVAARPGAPSVNSWADFTALSKEQSALFISALSGLNSGPDFYVRGLMQLADMPQVVGFDLFDIQRAASYGQPPSQVGLLEADFDPDAVIAAHTARGYTHATEDGMTLLCGAKGCDDMSLNLDGVNPANPFGGSLGRSQPVLIGDGVIASSASIGAVAELASTLVGETHSLAAQPDYHAAAEAITQDGTLLQAAFIRPADIPQASAAAMRSNLSSEQTQAILGQIKADFVPLLQYNLIAFADTASADQQTTLIALVYTNHDQAETAAATFPARLAQAESIQTQRSFGDMLDDRGVTATDVSIYDASSNRSVVVIALHSPLPSATTPESEQPEPMSRVYALLIRALYAQDVGWLATQF
jgi:hypothetical protein